MQKFKKPDIKIRLSEDIDVLTASGRAPLDNTETDIIYEDELGEN